MEMAKWRRTTAAASDTVPSHGYGATSVWALPYSPLPATWLPTTAARAGTRKLLVTDEPCPRDPAVTVPPANAYDTCRSCNRAFSTHGQLEPKLVVE